ncbi:MAG: radical SAM family heme chaperone HemW [Bacillota bacterium]
MTGLYIHVPFCLKKCSYCDFFSLPVERDIVSCYMDSLFREMKIHTDRPGGNEKNVDSVYLGGGTPTCLSAENLAAIIEMVNRYFNISPGSEITVEANPGTVDSEKLESLRRSGVNRISIGFQSCQEDLLATLGRVHSYPQAEEAFYTARGAGFENINVDLIFGIPGQTLEHWRSCLENVAGLKPDHISAYSLHLEEGTPLYKRIESESIKQCAEDLEADMYCYLIDFLTQIGYVQYEISNFCLPGRACRHNLKYWHNLSYLGLGPSAHSFIGGRRFSNTSDLGLYIERLGWGILPVEWEEEPDLKNSMSETVFLGLRLTEGLDTMVFEKRFERDIMEVFGDQIESLGRQSLIIKEGNRIRLTKKGMLLGNRVFAEFV